MLTHNNRGGYLAPLILLSICMFGFLPLANVDIRLGKQVISEWCIFYFAIFFIFKNKYIKWFLVCVYSRYILMYLFPVFPINISTICVKSAYTTVNSILIYCLFYEGLCASRMSEQKLYNILCILGIIQAVNMILQFSGVWILFDHVGEGFPGFFSNPNMAGSFLAIITPCFFRKRWIYVFPLILASALLSHTDGAIIPILLISLAWCYFRINNDMIRATFTSFCVLFMIIASFFFFFSYDMRSLYQRFDVWEISFKDMFLRLPLVGYGPGQFKIVFPMIHRYLYGYTGGNGIAIQAHNEYIQSLVEFGLFGMSIVACFIINIIKKGFKCRVWIPLSGVCIALLNSSVNFLFHTVVCVIVLIYFSIIEKENRHEKNSNFCMFNGFNRV